MSYPSHPLADLVIPINTKPSNEIVKARFKTARALSIHSGAVALTGTINVEGKGVDGNWRVVQKSGSDVVVTTGNATLVEYPGRFEAVRVNSGTNEAAARTFEVQTISELP